VDWYLVRTKPSKERWVHDQLADVVQEVFLPLLATPRRAIAPLFPCYLFAQLDLSRNYFDVRYLSGVQGLVPAGRDPLAVPVPIIDEIKCRGGVDGVVKIEEKLFAKGDRVTVRDGRFRGFEGIFERYLSGAERVAILLGTVEASGARVVLRADALRGR
jgi:transcription antitermination factor NusG